MAKVLLGFMGAGKSTIARGLDPNYLDMDALIAVSYTHLDVYKRQIQVFLIEHIFRVRNRIMQIGEILIIVASIILFIDSILSL